eukprot:361751-Chlamydomonas_euryale.AAC.2
MGSSNDLNSTVPTADDGSIGVNMKWLRGDTTMTSYCSVSMTCGCGTARYGKCVGALTRGLSRCECVGKAHWPIGSIQEGGG